MHQDRGEYRGFYVALPDSPEFQELSPEARAIFYPLKLKLGKAGISVFYPESLPRLTGYPFEAVSKALQELQETGWLIVERNVFWIRNGLRFDPAKPLLSPNQRKGIQEHLSTLPKLNIVNDFARYYGLEEPWPESAPKEKGSERVPEPLRTTEDRRQKTEDGNTDPPGVAHAREASPAVEIGSVRELEFEPEEEPPPLVPGDIGCRPVIARPELPAGVRVPFGNLDWEGRVSGSVVLREWINLQPIPPSRADRDRFGMTCKRIADEHSCGEVALAFLGMSCIWPFAPPEILKNSPGEPWTPDDLRKNFAKAIAAAPKHPVFAEQRALMELEEAAASGRSAW